MARPLPPELGHLEDHLHKWASMGKSIQRWYVILGIISTSASLSVATFAYYMPPWGISLVSFAAALSVGLISRFNLGRKVADVWAAWRHLNTARMRFQNVSSFSEGDLIDAYAEAEQILGCAFYASPTTKTTSSPPQE